MHTTGGRTVRRNVSQDAVVVIPGIMGSTLKTATGTPLWGFEKLHWYARMWSRRHSSLAELALTSEERDGRYGRIQATGLLKLPAYAPFLHGFEPYTRLVDRIGKVVADPAAILEFAYDWRLPVQHNAGRLAAAAHDHLRAWRSHDAYTAMLRELPQLRPARLVLVAHSMGGLLVRALPLVSHDELDIRASVTLGTPFDGAAKAAVMLNRGEGGTVPLPRRRLRDLAATLPGVHDLLPGYRCVDDAERDPRRLTPADVAVFGGDATLATASLEFHRRTAAVPLVDHVALVGTAQPTVASLSLRDGVVTGHPHTFALDQAGAFGRNRHGVLDRFPGFGDGTVPRNSATLDGPRPATLPQQHGALAQSPEAIGLVSTSSPSGSAAPPGSAAATSGWTSPTWWRPGRSGQRS